MSNDKKDKKRSPFSAFVHYEDDRKKGKVDPNRSNYGSYLFGSAFEDPSDLDGSEPTNWTSYTSGRIGVRLFSRGLMGATLYTLAHHAAPRQLKYYNHEAKWSELPAFTDKPLQYVAKAWDVTAAPLVRSWVRLVSPAEKAEEYAEQATWFRSKNNFHAVVKRGNGLVGVKGRSLGSEITGMTFDFAAGSVGDSWGRNIAAIADPNRPNEWYQDGKMDWGKFAKSSAASAWDILSLKQGEDWAAALPYVYQMRWQRQALNKVQPGFKLTSDRQLNGGSWLLDGEGSIIGNYSKMGALDLQLRFTGYNWYTLMYRDLYRSISDSIQSWRDHDRKLPGFYVPDSPLHTALDGAAQLFRYATKSLIKATIYMTPAVPFFWVTRTPQTKYKGIGVHLPDGKKRMRADGGVIETLKGEPFSFHRVDHSFKNEMVEGFYADFVTFPALHSGVTLKNIPNKVLKPGFDPYSWKHSRGVFDTVLTPFGRVSHNTGNLIHRLGRGFGMGKLFAYDIANASISYTPYMIAKAETALRWDRPGAGGVNLMDNAIYRFIDGVTSLSLGEAKGGLIDIRAQVLNPPSNVKLSTLVTEPDETPETKVADITYKSAIEKSAESSRDQVSPDSKIQGNPHIELENGLSAPSGVTIH